MRWNITILACYTCVMTQNITFLAYLQGEGFKIYTQYCNNYPRYVYVVPVYSL